MSPVYPQSIELNPLITHACLSRYVGTWRSVTSAFLFTQNTTGQTFHTQILAIGLHMYVAEVNETITIVHQQRRRLHMGTREAPL